MRSWAFAKGHGTQNDFVLIEDRDSTAQIGPAEVRAICDRRAGVGGDGLLRVVTAKHVQDWQGDGELWFMDYRNADGSVSEMCGNGLRVFVRYLLEEGLVDGSSLSIATRAGVLAATALPDGRIRVSMGPVTVRDAAVTVTTADGGTYSALSADVGNPHAVCFEDDLGRLDLATAPRWSPLKAFPNGVNVEFVRVVGERHLAMRVFERGVGETRSCGTGTVAAAAAAAVRAHGSRAAGDEVAPPTYRVDVPGGTVEVELGVEQAYLTGPAVIVARGQLTVDVPP